MKPIHYIIGLSAVFMLFPKRVDNGGSEELSYLGRDGLPRGMRNNNPGNIRITQTNWQGKVPNQQNTDGAFEQFQTYQWGIRAMTKLLINYMRIRNLRTVRQIISTYAPSSENNTAAYIQRVSSDTGFNPDWPLSPDYSTMQALVKSLAKVENGREAVSNSQFAAAWKLI